MKTQIPRARLMAFLICAAGALGLFLFLNSTFGGPTLFPGGGSSYLLKTTFPDSQNLVKKSIVMYRGFQVGEVDDVAIVHGVAKVTFTIDSQYAPLREGTIVQVDHRTFLQEPFVNVYPGPQSRPKLRSGSTVGAIPTVEPDDALQVFDPETRRLLDQGTRSLARGLRAPNAGDQVNRTISGLDQALGAIRALAGTLTGQEQSISTLVRSSATALEAIASRQAQLTQLIGSGRVVADTFAAQSNALGSGIDGLNRLLATTQDVLPRIRPLLARATPTLQHAATTAAALVPALATIRPAVRYAQQIAVRLDPSARAAAPAFINLIASEKYLLPLARGLVPAVANLVPLLHYIQDNLKGWEAFIANGADSLNHGDRLGPWFQGFLDLTPGGLAGSSAPCSSAFGLCVNPYPKPGDARDPQPYRRGEYPRLTPYFPK